jgi:hypothetical protein
MWHSIISHSVHARAFKFGFIDNPTYSPDLTPRGYHLFTNLKNWFGSQCYSSNGELMEGPKCCWGHRQLTYLTQAYKNLFPDMTGAAVLAVTMLSSSLSMYVSCIEYFFLIACLVKSLLQVTFWISLILCGHMICIFTWNQSRVSNHQICHSFSEPLCSWRRIKLWHRYNLICLASILRFRS